MVALIALGLVLTRVLGKTTPKVSKDDAVAVARPNVDFKPQGYNIRLVRQGIPNALHALLLPDLVSVRASGVARSPASSPLAHDSTIRG